LKHPEIPASCSGLKTLFSRIPNLPCGIGSGVTKDHQGPGDLREFARTLRRGTEQESRRAKEMVRQVKSLTAEMKQTEARLRAAEMALRQSARRTARLRRRLQKVAGRRRRAGGTLWDCG
jgi:septal ring factor EnvC (AmiA/AmiB activator)